MQWLSKFQDQTAGFVSDLKKAAQEGRELAQGYRDVNSYTQESFNENWENEEFHHFSQQNDFEIDLLSEDRKNQNVINTPNESSTPLGKNVETEFIIPAHEENETNRDDDHSDSERRQDSNKLRQNENVSDQFISAEFVKSNAAEPDNNNILQEFNNNNKEDNETIAADKDETSPDEFKEQTEAQTIMQSDPVDVLSTSQIVAPRSSQEAVSNSSTISNSNTTSGQSLLRGFLSTVRNKGSEMLSAQPVSIPEVVDLPSAQNVIQNLLKDNKRLTQRVKQLADENQIIFEDGMRFTREAANAQCRADEYQKQFEQCKSEITILMRELDFMKAEADRTTGSRILENVSLQKLTEVQRKNDQMSNLLVDKETTITEMNHRLNILKDENMRLAQSASELSALQGSFASLSLQQQMKDDEIIELKNELEDFWRKNILLEDNLKSVEREFERQKEGVDQQTEAKDTEMLTSTSSLVSQLVSLERQIREREFVHVNELQNLKRELQETIQNNELIKKELKEIENVKEMMQNEFEKSIMKLQEEHEERLRILLVQRQDNKISKVPFAGSPRFDKYLNENNNNKNNSSTKSDQVLTDKPSSESIRQQLGDAEGQDINSTAEILLSEKDQSLSQQGLKYIDDQNNIETRNNKDNNFKTRSSSFNNYIKSNDKSSPLIFDFSRTNDKELTLQQRISIASDDKLFDDFLGDDNNNNKNNNSSKNTHQISQPHLYSFGSNHDGERVASLRQTRRLVADLSMERTEKQAYQQECFRLAEEQQVLSLQLRRLEAELAQVRNGHEDSFI